MNSIEKLIIENTRYKEIPLVFRYSNSEAKAIPVKAGQKVQLSIIKSGKDFHYIHDGKSVDFADLNAGHKSDDLMFYKNGKIGYYERATKAFGYNRIADLKKSLGAPTQFTDDDGINKGGRAHFSTRYDDTKLVISIHGDEPVYDAVAPVPALSAYSTDGIYL